jgi:predicted Zn-ribbon and HTH transcriptional regulator
LSYTPWKNGECGRGHDITRPENVYEYMQKRNGHYVQKRVCNVCKTLRKHDEVMPMDRVMFEPRTCKECGRKYIKPPEIKMPQHTWLRRKYCSNDCKWLASKRKARNPRKPLSDEQVAHLRQLVGYDPTRDRDRDSGRMRIINSLKESA